MSGWVPGYLLPNISVSDVIENEYYVLTSINDGRVLEVRQLHPEFDRLVTRFTDEFGVQVAPALLMVRAGSGPEVLNIEAVSGFRDAIALSFVCHNRALRTIYPRSRTLQFSSSFDFYPWMTSVDYSGIVGSSPALTGWHKTATFHGHTTPGLPHAELRLADCDEALLDALIGTWKRRFITHKDEWRSIALFRSLNMAYAASQLPSGPDMTHFALGRSIGLWISAIEILAHPGVDGQVGFRNVYELLEQVDWETEKCCSVSHIGYAGGRKRAPTILPCWTYGELLQARNDFLHGEPIGLDRLQIASSGRTLYNFAAPVYRLCLTAFLGLKAYGPRPSLSDYESAARFVSWGMDIEQGRRNMERALGKILEPDNDLLA